MRTAILLACVLMTTGFAAAQEKPVPAAPPNSIYVGADGKFESAPDTALITFNIAPQEESAQEAYERASKAAEQVRKILRSNGIDPKSAEVGFYSLQPVYDYRTPKRRLVGYRVTTSVSVKVKDFTKVGPILNQLNEVEFTEGHSMSYLLENIDAAKAKAVEDAYQRARRNAAVVAQAAGRTLGELYYSTVDVFEHGPIIMAAPQQMKTMRATAEAAPPPPTAEFGAQKITVNAHVNALFLMK